MGWSIRTNSSSGIAEIGSSRRWLKKEKNDERKEVCSSNRWRGRGLFGVAVVELRIGTQGNFVCKIEISIINEKDSIDKEARGCY